MIQAKRRTHLKAAVSATFGPMLALLSIGTASAQLPSFGQMPLIGQLPLINQPAPCGLTPTNGTESRTMIYSFTDFPRQYSIHVPAGLSGKVPLLVSVPDYGSNPESQETKTGWTPFSDANKFIVVYPKGNNDVFNPMDQNPDKDFLRALVAEVSSEYCVDDTRVYIEGQGISAAMSEKMACTAADVYAAAGLYEARTNPMLFNCAPSRKIALAVVQPEDAMLMSVADGKALRDSWISRNACSTSGTPDANAYGQNGEVFGGCAGGVSVLWRTYTDVNGGGGFGGFGGGMPTGYSGAYPSGAAGDDFRSKLWSFFMAHPRP